MKKITAVLFFSIFFFPYLIPAQSLTGREIMEKSFNRNAGKDSCFRMEMTLIDKGKDKMKRSVKIYAKDYGSLRRVFIEFDEPPDIRNTRFLSLENSASDDTQYLYLPALGRARRLVTTQKNLRFVNTDFTYEDMQRRKPDKDVHKVLKEENYSGYNCYIIESVPIDPNSSQYSKRINWVDKESLVIVKILFYDKKECFFKQYAVKELQKKSGIWTTVESVMEDFKDKHATRMKVTDIEYNQGIRDDFFSLQKLEEN